MTAARRFASFRKPGGGQSWGRVEGEQIVDLGPGGAAVADSLKAAIELDLLDRLPPTDETRMFPVDSVRLLPLIPDPGKIICVGANYQTHRDEMAAPPPAAPTIFTRFADTQIGHGEPARKPAASGQFDYEGELALVIGREAWQVSEAEAERTIAGYAPYDDLSVRDWQRASSQWTPGKNFPATGAFGPYLVPAADIPDVAALRLETRVNGEVRQSASLADMIFPIPAIIAFVTAFTRLSPGDVIVTGTPGGVGIFRDPPALLEVGDVVEVEIGGIGLLVNPVAAGD